MGRNSKEAQQELSITKLIFKFSQIHREEMVIFLIFFLHFLVKFLEDIKIFLFSIGKKFKAQQELSITKLIKIFKFSQIHREEIINKFFIFFLHFLQVS